MQSSLPLASSLSMVGRPSRKRARTEAALVDSSVSAELWLAFSSEHGAPHPPLPLTCSWAAEGSAYRDQCDVCHHPVAWSEEGFQTCTHPACGLIYTDVVDDSPEWRFFAADDAQGTDPSRCGPPVNPLLKESSYGCKILGGNNTSSEMRRIRRYIDWQSMPAKEKSLYDDFQRIVAHATHAGISKKIIDDAIRCHHRIVGFEQHFRSHNKDSLIAASVYVACRMNQFPRTPKELASIFFLDPPSAIQGCKNVQTILNQLELHLDDDKKTLFAPTHPVDFIERFCSKLLFTTELTRLATFLAMQVEKRTLIPENIPQSVAAGIVYFVAQLANMPLTKSQITAVTETSDVTIQKCYTKLMGLKHTLIPSVVLARFGHASTESAVSADSVSAAAASSDSASTESVAAV
jgi:transcription initiation factor TFIIB